MKGRDHIAAGISQRLVPTEGEI